MGPLQSRARDFYSPGADFFWMAEIFLAGADFCHTSLIFCPRGRTEKKGGGQKVCSVGVFSLCPIISFFLRGRNNLSRISSLFDWGQMPPLLFVSQGHFPLRCTRLWRYSWMHILYFSLFLQWKKTSFFVLYFLAFILFYSKHKITIFIYQKALIRHFTPAFWLHNNL